MISLLQENGGAEEKIRKQLKKDKVKDKSIEWHDTKAQKRLNTVYICESKWCGIGPKTSNGVTK